MFWQYRLDMRDVVVPIRSMPEKELDKKLPQVRESIALKLEDSSVFRKSEFPKRFRSGVNTVTDLNELLDELYDFAEQEKVWLGL